MEQEGQSVANYFKVSLSGKSAVHLASAFQTCSEEHQKEFRSLSVEEQIDLLKVPVKRQALLESKRFVEARRLLNEPMKRIGINRW